MPSGPRIVITPDSPGASVRVAFVTLGSGMSGFGICDASDTTSGLTSSTFTTVTGR